MTSLSRASLAVMLGLVIFVTGCGDKKKTAEFAPVKNLPENVKNVHGHAHAEGPHGGHVFDLGDHAYMGEITFDAKANALTVYVLDHHDMKKSVASDSTEITAELQIDKKPTKFQLKAAPLENDPKGKSSRFELKGNAVIAEHIKDAEDLHGNVTVSVNGKSYKGTISHDHGGHDDHGHDHHGHDHKTAKTGKTAHADHDHDHDDDHKTAKTGAGAAKTK